MSTLTGGVSTGEGSATAKAYFECVNANGGINGHPIQYTVVDDGLNPAKAAQSATSLVNDTKVVGIVGGSYLECAVAGPIYQKAHVFEVEGVGATAQCLTNPNIVTTSMGSPLSASAMIDAATAEGAKKIALLVPNTPGLGDAVQAASEATAKQDGATIVKTTQYQPGVQDATSLVLSAASANPDAIAITAIKSDLVTLLNAAAQQGLKNRIKFIAINQIYGAGVPSQLGSAWDGGRLKVQHQWAPIGADTPDVKLWKAVVAKYAPGAPLDELSEGMFLAAKIFADTLAKIHGPITRASVGQALQSISNYQSDMLCAPFSWPKGTNRLVNNETRIAEIDNGAYKDDGGCHKVTPVTAP